MFSRNPYLEKLDDSTLLGLSLFVFGATVVSFSYGISSPWFQLFVATFFAAVEAFLNSPAVRSARDRRREYVQEALHRWFFAHFTMTSTQPWGVRHPWLAKGIGILILLLLAVVALFAVFNVSIIVIGGSLLSGVSH